MFACHAAILGKLQDIAFDAIDDNITLFFSFITIEPPLAAIDTLLDTLLRYYCWLLLDSSLPPCQLRPLFSPLLFRCWLLTLFSPTPLLAGFASRWRSDNRLLLSAVAAIGSLILMLSPLDIAWLSMSMAIDVITPCCCWYYAARHWSMLPFSTLLFSADMLFHYFHYYASPWLLLVDVIMICQSAIDGHYCWYFSWRPLLNIFRHNPLPLRLIIDILLPYCLFSMLSDITPVAFSLMMLMIFFARCHCYYIAVAYAHGAYIYTCFDIFFFYIYARFMPPYIHAVFIAVRLRLATGFSRRYISYAGMPHTQATCFLPLRHATAFASLLRHWYGCHVIIACCRWWLLCHMILPSRLRYWYWYCQRLLLRLLPLLLFAACRQPLLIRYATPAMPLLMILFHIADCCPLHIITLFAGLMMTVADISLLRLLPFQYYHCHYFSLTLCRCCWHYYRFRHWCHWCHIDRLRLLPLIRRFACLIH